MARVVLLILLLLFLLHRLPALLHTDYIRGEHSVLQPPVLLDLLSLPLDDLSLDLLDEVSPELDQTPRLLDTGHKESLQLSQLLITRVRAVAVGVQNFETALFELFLDLLE